jgi:DNA repair photolyase
MKGNTMNTIPAKTIITKRSNPYWFGTDYNMNLYKGCSHGCIYCDSRSDCYQITDFDTIRMKDKAIDIIHNELHRKVKSGVIGTGAMSDPYNPIEKTYQLTRHALKLIDQYQFGSAIATKSALITRDIDILTRIKTHSPVICKITITAFEDSMSNIIEPNVSTSSKRFEAVKELSSAGIYTGILLMPLLPFLTDTKENILSIVHTAYQNGAKFIYPLFGLTLRNGQREYFYQKLQEAFPEKQLVQTYKSLYGSSYECHIPNAKELYTLFEKECNRLGILFRMTDIIQSYKKDYNYHQYSFFT